MPNYALVMSIVATNPNVKGVSPFILAQALVETQPAEGQPLQSAPYIRGVAVDTEGSVSVLPKSILRGEFDLSGHGLVVGAEFAAGMHLSVGDRLAIYSKADLKKMKESRGKDEQIAILPGDYEVRGIFDVGYFEYNANVLATSLENA